MHKFYFLKPKELFSEVALRGPSDNDDGESNFDENKTNFILEDIQEILTNVQLSTMGNDSEEDLKNVVKILMIFCL